jgi:hypothetical protein
MQINKLLFIIIIYLYIIYEKTTYKDTIFNKNLKINIKF